MIDIATINDFTPEKFNNFVKKVNELPKVPCPINHFFAPGVYVRQMIIPAGTVAIGHKHLTRHITTLIQGKMMIVKPGDKKGRVIEAPETIIADPGHKMVYAFTDCVVQNVHPNPDNITDHDELEKIFIDKTVIPERINHDLIERDHMDFAMLKDIRFSEYDEFIPIPDNFRTVISIRKSDIDGKGVFVSIPYIKDEYIAPYQIGGRPTIIAKFVNHSAEPNATLFHLPGNEIAIIAKKDIMGCTGDSKGEELTIDYRELESCHGEQ